MPGDDKLFHLQGVYNSLYNATTRPDFRFVISRYFIDEWVPLLGPSLAWLVVGLRQQCFWNRRRDWCIVDKATLARETALDERTIERCFKKQFSDWFIIEVSHRYQYRTQIGKKVRDKNRYQLLLDEPLSPRHQLGLAALVKELAPASPESLDTALAVAETLLSTPHLTDKITYTDSIPPDLQRRSVLEIVADTLEINLAASATDERVATLDQRCAELYNLIIQPNKIHVGWQYFRLEWVRLLGHALAWVIIYLRRHCYWDEASGELRDTLTIYKKDLAAAINQTSRNLANLLDNPYALLFFTLANPPEALNSGSEARNKPTQYRVRMVDEPLTPADQEQVRETLRQRLQDDHFGRNPENGQLNLFPVLDRLSNRQDFAYGQVPAKLPPTEPKDRRLEAETAEKMPQHEPALIGKNAATLNDSLLIPSKSKDLNQQQIHGAAAKSSALEMMLDDLSVQEPARSRLLANPDLTVTQVGAWFLYAETQANLIDPQAYVIKRLLANDAPPKEFIAFARLDDTTWSLFEGAAAALRTGQPLSPILAPELIETFVSWAEIYAGLAPLETRYLLSLATSERLLPDQPATPPAEIINSRQDLARRLWGITLAQLQRQMTKQTFDTWLKQTEVLDYGESEFVIDAKSAFAKDWLENRLIKTIEAALTNVVGEPTRVRFALSEPIG